MEQNDYLTLSEDGTKVKNSNNDYKENKEMLNCLNEIRDDAISGCSNITMDETLPTLCKNYHFSESIANKFWQ